jgi:hypothetical protein
MDNPPIESKAENLNYTRYSKFSIKYEHKYTKTATFINWPSDTSVIAKGQFT